MTIRITLSLIFILLSGTFTYAQNTPGASIENAKKIREARPSFVQLVNQVKELKHSLLELEIAITEANTDRLVERNADFQKTIEAQNENFQKTLELMEKIGQIKSDLANHYNLLNNPLNQLRNEFDNRGDQLFQWRRVLDNAEARVTQVESQIQEDGMSTAQQVEGLTNRIDALETRVQNISAEYVQKAEFELREQKLLTRILYLEEENQLLLQRFQVSETLIQRLGEQIITNSGRLAEVTEGALTHLSRIEQIEADISRFESFSDRLDALAAKDMELDRDVFAINDIEFRLEELATGLYPLQAELLRLEGDTKNLDDISRLNSEDLNVVLRRLDELEIVQPTLADQYSLKDRMSELLYQLKILKAKIISMEEQFARSENSSDAGLDQLRILENKIMMMEEHFVRSENSSDAGLDQLRILENKIMMMEEHFARSENSSDEDLERLRILENKIMMMEAQLASSRSAPDVEGDMSATEDPAQPSSE